MIATIQADTRKTFRRPAFRVFVALFFAVPVVAYAADFYGALHSGTPGAPDLREFYPNEFVHFIISAAFPLGAAVALVMGALLVGSDYSWATLKTALTQGPGRLTVFGGRCVVFLAWMLALAVLMFVSAAGSSLIVALTQAHAVVWPATADILKGIGASWLALAVYGSLGILLAQVFRQAAVALGLGLIYIVIVEDLVLTFLDGFNGGQLKWLANLFDGQNALSLLASFTSGAFGRVRVPEVDATRATVTLMAYLAALLFVSAFIARRRDVA